MSEKSSCPACAGTDLSEIYRLDGIPVQSCILLDSMEEARAFPRHGLVLKYCDGCGFIFNAVFEGERVDYASATEESQHFSGTFNGFARELVAEIAGRYDLSGKLTLEIGCGKGDFLQALVMVTNTRGLGVDPGFIPERFSDASGCGITFQRAYFDPAKIERRPDFIICRHTLEHIPEVGRFIEDLAEVIGDRSGVGIFFETPDVRRVLAEGAFWDIYYEHCSYFTLGSHARLFRCQGIDISDLYLAYDDQYIIQYAEAGANTSPLDNEHDLDGIRAFAAAFPKKVAATRAYWTAFVRDRHQAGRRVAVWGGGSKCVSFLTTNNLGGEIAQVVDINPFKQGKYLPGTGHQVVSPEALRGAPPDTVIVMNPVYRGEIAADLETMGLTPELVAV